MNDITAQSEPRGLGYGRVPSSLLCIFPLFLAYEIGLLFTPAHNGVDYISAQIFALLDNNSAHFLYLHLGLAGIFLLFLTYLWHRNALYLDSVVPMVLEAAIYALCLGSVIVFVIDGLVELQILAIGFPSLAIAQTDTWGHTLVVSIGAGVHEELVFRLLMMGVGGWLLSKIGFPRGLAIVVAATVAAFFFAAAHHMGDAGDVFSLSLFTYRAIAGLAFAIIFYTRSLAHAVYCHFFYDFYVMIIQ